MADNLAGLESAAFREQYENLVVGIPDPVELTVSLYSIGMMSIATRDRVIDTRGNYDKKVILVSAVESTIATEAGRFEEFVSVLKNDPSLSHLAQRLKASYDRLVAEELQGRPNRAPSITKLYSKYAQYLRSKYSSRILPTSDKWPPTTSRKYVNLAIIEKEEMSKDEADEFTQATIHGDIEDIMKKKKPVELQQIGILEDGSIARCIIVQGAPGVGKTTMAWELCKQWKDKKALEGHPLVILLKMRDRSIQKATSLQRLFPNDDEQLQSAVFKEATRKGGRGVCFILEGYDELPEDLQNESLFASLIEGSVLSKAAVLVTSRPSASEILYEKCKFQKLQHIEILGFTKDQMEEYTEDIIGHDPQLLQSFRQYLSCNPHIRGMMYIPLNCAVIIEVYKSTSGGEIVPKTQTELYTALLKSLLRRHLSAHNPQCRQRTWQLPKFTDLPQEVYANLLRLCQIAYNGVCERQLVFPTIPRDVDTLGLIQAVPELYATEKASVSYNFVHFTVQEYLAAYHISLQATTMQVVFYDQFAGKQHMAIVLRFLAGLTSFLFESTKTTSVLAGITRFLKGLVKSRTPADCLRSFYHSRHTYMESLHWMFETQNKELISQALGLQTKGNCSLQSLSPFDCYVLHYCMNSSIAKWKLTLSVCGINEESMQMLAGSTTGGFASVESLDLSGNPLGSAGAALLSSALRGNNILTDLHLRQCKMGADGVSTVISVLITIPTLRILDLSGNTMDVASANQLAQFVRASDSITELRVACCELCEESVQEVALALAHNNTLREMELQSNPIGKKGAQALAETLSVNESLVLLSLVGCGSMQAAGATQVVEALQYNVTLKNLQLPDGYKDSVVPLHFYGQIQHRINWFPDVSTPKVNLARKYVSVQHLASALDRNTVLTELQLEGCSMDDQGTAQVVKVAFSKPTLTVLNLSGIGVGDSTTKMLASSLLMGTTAITELRLARCGLNSGRILLLAEGLYKTSSLKVLDLEQNSIGEDGLHSLATALKGNTSLTHLMLENCSIGADAIVNVGEVLQNTPMLKHLKLDWNPIGPDGIQHLATGLKNCSALTELSLKHCGITTKSFLHLRESLPSTLQILLLDGNEIGSEGVQYLSRALRGSTTLTNISLTECDIGAEGVYHLVQVLSQVPTLTVLDLSGNMLGSEGAAHLSALQLKTNLRELRLTNCGIDAAGTLHIAEVLHSIPTINTLTLSDNQIGPDGAQHLAAALKDSTCAELRLGRCGMNAKAVFHLTGALIGNPHLRVLDLSGSSLGLEGVQNLAIALKGSTTLCELRLRNCYISSDGVSHLAETLSAIPTLRVLELSWNRFGSEGAKRLAIALKGTTTLCELRLQRCVISADGVSHLAETLSAIPTLRVLELSESYFGSEGAKHLAIALKGSTTLCELILRNCDISADGVSHLAETLSAIPTLRVLDLSRNKFGSGGAKHLAIALKGSTTLCELRLEDCHISSNGVSHLAETLSAIPTLRVLELSWNRFGSEGAKHLAIALKGSTALCELRLRYCNISSNGVSHLAETLSAIPTLRVLDLGSNTFGSEGAKQLAIALKGSTTLCELRLQGCDISSDGVSHLVETLSAIPTLRVLDLSWNKFGSGGTKHLAIALKGSTTLCELRLESCNISSDGVSHLVETLSAIPTLRVLDLSWNKFGSGGTKHLALLLKRSHSLGELYIGDCKIDDDGTCELVRALLENSSLRVLSLYGNPMGERGAEALRELNKSLGRLHIRW